jgi:hypothetical protein
MIEAASISKPRSEHHGCLPPIQVVGINKWPNLAWVVWPLKPRNVFDWMSGDAYASATNSITIVVIDNGLPPLKDAKSFAVAVVSQPLFGSVALSNNIVAMTWSVIADQTCQSQYNNDLISTN